MLPGERGRCKKLLIAVSSTFGQWSSNETDGGKVECHQCGGKGEYGKDNVRCWVCDGTGFLVLYGKPEDHITGNPDDAFLVVWMVWSCRKRSWTPLDLERQSAWFMSAFYFLIGKVMKAAQESRKQKRNGGQQNP